MTNKEQELESWDIKAFSAEDVDGMFKQAILDFKEDSQNWDNGTCTLCNAENVPLAQHWNDVGGSGTLMCQICFTRGIIWFWMCEEAGIGTTQGSES
jgi:hypothetical protein